MIFEVLIVDDDKITMLINKNVILKTRFHPAPLTFPDGRETLDFILNNDTNDKTYCILLDINMPLMNGWQFLDAIEQHEINARMLVVIVTSSIDTLDKQKALSYPKVIGFLEKPINFKIIEDLKKNEGLSVFFT